MAAGGRHPGRDLLREEENRSWLVTIGEEARMAMRSLDISARELSGEDLLLDLDLSRLPRHVAIIMDGNGRWAAKRRLPRIAGHRAGADAEGGASPRSEEHTSE